MNHSFLSALAFGSWLMMALSPFISSLLDIFYPLEIGKHERIWPMHANYVFFDKDEHFIAVSIHYAVAFFGLVSLFIAEDTSFVIGVEYSCGLFSVVM